MTFTSQPLPRATITPGIFDPVPVVTIDGQDVASGPSGPADGLIALDDLSVTWGREELLEQPTPATGSLTLFDPSSTWATSADRRGLPVTLRWEGTLDGQVVSAVFFRGRIGARLTVSRRTVVHPITGERMRGSLVEVPLQSVLVDLANNVPTTAWPVETMTARVARITAAAQAAGFLTGGIYFRDYWGAAQVRAYAAADQVSLHDHLLNVYTSCGDLLSYDPGRDEVRPIMRRDYAGWRTRGQLWRDNAARDDQGAYVRAVVGTGGDGAVLQPVPMYLDAAALEYDPADGITTPPRISRVALAHPNMDAAWATRNIEARVKTEDGGVVDETLVGARTAKADSILGPQNYADVALSDLEFLVRREGSKWLLEPLVLNTRKTGGFETLEAARWLLGGFETLTSAFLQRSFLPEYGVRPIYAVMGGRIGYRRGGWELELVPAPITTTLPQHAITWEEVDDGSTEYQVQWWDTPHPQGMHPSVTYEDLAYVGRGLAVTTIPPDQGFDR